jgi:multicomponent K+:H+ antiporter subunit A
MPLLVLAIPLAASLVAAALPARAHNRAALLSGAASVVGLLAVVLRFREVAGGDVVVERLAWMPELGVDLVLRLDGFPCSSKPREDTTGMVRWRAGAPVSTE